MKIAVVGSRGFDRFDISPYIPDSVTEIVSGGAVGVDSIAKDYAISHNIKYTEFPPKYSVEGPIAPLLRNLDIIAYSDLVLVFWDKQSSGSRFVIDCCKRLGVEVRVFTPKSITGTA
ncbi:MAG: hypothetical protein E7583_02935 [Ruminococcaceae bacterium]|nr:hypothetical protein [Oscillospiraceae bacterium]